VGIQEKEMKHIRYKLKDGVTIKKWYPPKAIIVPPKPRVGNKQLTVLRHDDNGMYFVDEFAERSSCQTHENRRNMNWIQCPHLEFNVAINCCHHYCSAPCRAHLESLQRHGWYKNGERAPFADRMSLRGKNVSTDE